MERWIAMYHSVMGPKLRALEEELECSTCEALGILVILWFYGQENTDKTGKLLNVTERHLKRELFDRTMCDLDKVVEALYKTGWLDKDGDKIFVHDFGVWQEPWFRYKDKKEHDKKYQKNRRDYSAEEPPLFEEIPEETAESQKESSNHAPREKKYPAPFEELWKIYPRKKEKAAAYKAYLTRLREGWEHEQLLEATVKYAEKMSGVDETFIKHGSTFFSATTPFTDFLETKLVDVNELDKERRNPFWEYGGSG